MHISFIRRLDELGRIVIPKEIRTKLNFSSGDLLDLNIGSDSLIIKKSNSTFNKEYIDELINLVEYLSDYDLILTNMECIVAKSSKLDEIKIEDKISDILSKLVKERKSEIYLNGVYISDKIFLEGKVYVKSLIKDSNELGLIILRTKDNKDVNLFLNMLVKLLLQ